jgi:hypothetical protein
MMVGSFSSYFLGFFYVRFLKFYLASRVMNFFLYLRKGQLSNDAAPLHEGGAKAALSTV